MHLLVLSAFRPSPREAVMLPSWVSMHLLVLSAFRPDPEWENSGDGSLNAPFGAQCFPTRQRDLCPAGTVVSQCTFWCSVLSDLGLSRLAALLAVSMHLLVLSAFRHETPRNLGDENYCVSMHLLVLSAFRRRPQRQATAPQSCLNAPFGAQCFPTY